MISSHRLTKSPYVNVMFEAASLASKALLRDFNEVENLLISQKGPGDFVTSADKRAEKTIFKFLQEKYPHASFIMEEGGRVEGERDDLQFIIDPLDGTENFIHNIPHFCISIAVKKNGILNAGIIYDPIRDELFWAEKGLGAYLNRTRIRIKETSPNRSFTTLFTAVKAFHGREATPERILCFTQFMQKTKFRFLGSAALNLAYVAAGRADLAVSIGLESWDVAAGGLIVREAGGAIEGLSRTHDPFSGQSVAVGSPALVQVAQRAFKSAF